MAKKATTKKLEISLNVKERVLFPGILPNSGKKIEMILVSDLLKKVEFTPIEVAELGLKDIGGGRVRWDPRKNGEKSIELTKEQVEILKKTSEEFDAEGKVTLDLLPIFEKIDGLEI